MDANPDVLAAQVRARRIAVDNDLERLRLKLRQVDPRRFDPRAWVTRALPALAAAGMVSGLVWAYLRRRRARAADDRVVRFEATRRRVDRLPA